MGNAAGELAHRLHLLRLTQLLLYATAIGRVAQECETADDAAIRRIERCKIGVVKAAAPGRRELVRSVAQGRAAALHGRLPSDVDRRADQVGTHFMERSAEQVPPRYAR